MHEYSIVEALVARVDEEVRARGATGVHRLQVRIGELSGVEPELLTRAFETFRERTVCAGAELDLRLVPARWECSRCGGPIVFGGLLTCPSCHAPARLVQGDEIMLDRIEMEVL
jgi:hydrogenase nickel insertion protein HypA